MNNRVKWKEIIAELPEFYQECFNKQWNGELFTCITCNSELPRHKLFLTEMNRNSCKKCVTNKEFINVHTPKLFKTMIPVGFKVCMGCKKLLPEDVNHFTINQKGYYSKCKLCRGFKSYGETNTGINQKLITESKKKCKFCKLIKDISEFPKVRNTNTTRAEYCSDCKPIQSELEIERRSRSDLVDKKSEYDRKYYEQNKEYRLKYRSDWKKTSHGREVARRLDYKRESRKKNLLFNLTKDQWRNTKNYFNDCCAYCGISEEEHLEKVNKILSQDHVVPMDDDGAYSDFNIIPACNSCNSQKNNRDLEDFYMVSDKFTQERFLKVIDFFLEKV